MAHFSYSADGEVVRAFLSSTDFVRAIRGPVGSGKSVACCVEIFRRAVEQKPAPDGVRRTRWAVVRNTQPELRTTTIKTWLDWFPEKEYGKFNWSPPFTHHMKRGSLDCEVIFLALDKPEDVKKLLSLELTGVFINEAREIPKAIVDGATMRVGRYPSQRDGGPTWSGVIMDTNSPDEDHWWAIMSGECPPPDWMSQEDARALVKPASWSFFEQPGAMLPVKDAEGNVVDYKMNPIRENKKGVKDSYYKQMIAGKTHEWINVYVCNQYGTLVDGKPVYPEFDRVLHTSLEPVLPFAGQTTYVGIDFGLTPSAVFGQRVRGSWHILRELVAQDMGARRFAELLRGEMATIGGTFSVWGDPAGDQRAQTDEDTPFRVLRGAGIMAQPAHTNDISLRLDAVRAALTRLADKKPAFTVDARCTNLIKGFESGYHYRRLRVSGTERFQDMPDKNRFSHVHDALQYMMLGAGEGRSLMRPGEQQRAVVKEKNWDVFSRKPRAPKRPAIRGW